MLMSFPATSLHSTTRTYPSATALRPRNTVCGNTKRELSSNPKTNFGRSTFNLTNSDCWSLILPSISFFGVCTGVMDSMGRMVTATLNSLLCFKIQSWKSKTILYHSLMWVETTKQYLKLDISRLIKQLVIQTMNSDRIRSGMFILGPISQMSRANPGKDNPGNSHPANLILDSRALIWLAECWPWERFSMTGWHGAMVHRYTVRNHLKHIIGHSLFDIQFSCDN